MTSHLPLLPLLVLLACAGGDDPAADKDTAADSVPVDSGDTGGDTGGDTVEVVEIPEDWSWYLPFDGQVDDADGSLTYTSQGSYKVRWTDGIDGVGKSALGAQSCIAYTGSTEASDAASMSFWIRPEQDWDSSMSESQVITVFPYGTWQIVYLNGYLRVEVYSNDPRTASISETEVSLAGGEWHHLMWTVSSGALEVWVDGEAGATTTFPLDNAVMGHSDTMYFGCSSTSVAAAAVDEVRYYPRALSAEERAALSAEL